MYLNFSYYTEKCFNYRLHIHISNEVSQGKCITEKGQSESELNDTDEMF